MFKNHQIVAIQKTIENAQNNSSWNNATFKWFIAHEHCEKPKTYEITLDVVYLSSKRQVKVNGQLKHSTMATFGYESSFDIANGLHGHIKQEGIKFSFQLFINGVSFTELQNNKPRYEGLNEVSVAEIKQKEKSQQNRKIQTEVKNASSQKNQRKSGRMDSIKEEKKEVTVVQESEQKKIKDTQNQLLKILKAQKAHKK